MPPPFILDPQLFPETIVEDIEGLRKHNPQRFEMEQLTAITLVDTERQLVVGYKDVKADEFWVRGHMPGEPLLPGVLMCEAGAQLCAWFCSYVGLVGEGHFIAFGGMDDVRFRGMVRPGQRLWFVGKTEKLRPRRMVFQVQGFVEGSMVFHSQILGIKTPYGALPLGDE